jgi:hypothetical protein
MDEALTFQAWGDIFSATLGFEPFGFRGDVKNQGKLLVISNL